MSTPPNASQVTLEPEFIAAIVDIFENKVVFNRTLGLQALATSAVEVTATIQMRHELVGTMITTACMAASSAPA